MPTDPDAIKISTLDPGQQGLMYFKVIARTGSLLTLDLHSSGWSKDRKGQLRITTSGAEPFNIDGEFDELDSAGEDTPEDYRVEAAVFDVNVGDHVQNTDGVHYVVQVVGDGSNGLDMDTWSPSTNLQPAFTFDDIAENLGP
jgi:hypothetical protein